MARPFKGEAALSSALAVLKTATSVMQLRYAQAVALPLRYGLSLKQTAESLGVSPVARRPSRYALTSISFAKRYGLASAGFLADSTLWR